MSSAANYQGLWYKAPAESEAGWGINFAHQDDLIFASWFTYDTTGKPWWLVMLAQRQADGSFRGSLLQTTGSPFNAVPFNTNALTSTPVGEGTLSFASEDSGTFAYTVNGVTQSKPITRQKFGPLPTCTFGALADLSQATNYQDLWWAAPPGSESGWGVNFTHQGDTLFATWFTYDAAGKPMWVVAITNRTAPGTYTGSLFRTAGPPFSAEPFLPSSVTTTPVGSLTLTFANGNAGTFAYTLDGVTQSKAITRQVFRAPGTVCQSPGTKSAAEGLWKGTTSGGHSISGVVLDDGTYYFTYAAGLGDDVAGGVSGSSTATDGTFATSDGINVPFRSDFAAGSPLVKGTYVARTSLQLTFGAGAGAQTATLSYDASYEVPASVATLAGSYKGSQGHVMDAWSMTGTIDGAGAIKLAAACPFTGNATPRGGTGVFDLTLKSGDVCLNGPGKPGTGILLYSADTGKIRGLIRFKGSDMLFLVGTKQ